MVVVNLQLAIKTTVVLSIAQVVETEANREALRKELANMQRKMAEFEEEVRVREKDFNMALEDGRRTERKLAADRHNLEISLDNANSDIQVPRDTYSLEFTPIHTKRQRQVTAKFPQHFGHRNAKY